MRRLLPLLVVLASCAAPGNGLVPGQSGATDVRNVLGEPTLVRKAPGGGETLWYSRQPYGRENLAARIDSAGKLGALQNRLTAEQIATLRVNQSTADDVLDAIGPPFGVMRFPRTQRETWTYHVRRFPRTYSLHVTLSHDTVVREIFELDDSFNRRD